VILDPINDADCLGQLTKIARELAPTTLLMMVAKRLGSRTAIIRWFQSLPQADDTGAEQVRFIQCDVPQRTRLLPDDPNCVERSIGALMLLEVVDPKTARALATVDKPLRHTGLVEKHGAHWRAVDLFPRRNAARNFNWGEFGKDVLQGVHKYVGKPLLGAYGAGAAADWLGEQEDSWIGRDKKKQPEKKGTPPPAGKQPQPEPKREQPKPEQQKGGADYNSYLTKFIGAGAKKSQPTADGGGGKDAEKAKSQSPAGAPAGDRAAGRAPQARNRDGGDPHDQDAEARRRWWFLGR